MPKSERSGESKRNIKNAVIVSLIISITSFLFAVIGLSKANDREYYTRIKGDDNYLNNIEVRTKIEHNNLQEKKYIFHGSNGELPLTVLDKIDIFGKINYVYFDRKYFIDDDDQTKIHIKFGGYYLIGYNVLWNEMINDQGSTRETFIKSNNHQILTYSRSDTNKPQYIQQHMTHIEKFNSGDWIKIIFRQNSGHNVTLSSFGLWINFLFE